MNGVRIFVISPLVCASAGTAVGSIVSPLLMGTAQSPSEALDVSLGLLPYALIYAAPIGLVCGLLGAFLVVRLGTGRLRGASRRAWLWAGAGSGALTGASSSPRASYSETRRGSLGSLPTVDSRTVPMQSLGR